MTLPNSIVELAKDYATISLDQKAICVKLENELTVYYNGYYYTPIIGKENVGLFIEAILANRLYHINRMFIYKRFKKNQTNTKTMDFKMVLNEHNIKQQVDFIEFQNKKEKDNG